MRRSSSRRLTGRSLWLDGPGVIADVELAPGDTDPVPAWRAALERARAALGWPDTVAARRHSRGVSLGFAAPPDVLLTATYVNDWAISGGDAAALAALAARASAEARPEIEAGVAEARRRHLPVLLDEDYFTVGLGAGAVTVPLPRPTLPTPSSVGPMIGWRTAASLHDIPWHEAGRVPVVLVTGTNGKTTTVRLLARIGQHAGLGVGLSCSDGVMVAGETLEEGDWTGPAGARRVLRDGRVELAVLETARGGILRRGLAVEDPDVAVVTNVTPDHLGQFGVHTLEDLLEVKMTVTRGARHVVLNADDAALAPQRAGSWFSLTGKVEGAWLDGETLVCGELRLPVSEIPVTLGGAARYHVANALAAAAAARALGLPAAAIRDALRSFQPSAADNPGRANLVTCRGVTILLDYAHNLDGIVKTMELVRALPARRRLLSLGLPGDRADDVLAACARALLLGAPQRIVVRDPQPPPYLRGRQSGEVPALLASALLAAGFPDDAIGVAADEVSALEQALAWAEPGDLVVILPHAQREAVGAWLEARGVKAPPENGTGGGLA